MEKSLNQEIKDKFAIADVDIRTYSPLTLAYIGDGIFDVIIRSIVVGRGNTPVNQLHHKTSHVVKYDGERRPTFSPDGKYIAFTSATRRGAAWSDHDYPDGSWVSGVGGEFGYLTIIPADGKQYNLDEKGSGAIWLRQSKDSAHAIPCSDSLIWR